MGYAWLGDVIDFQSYNPPKFYSLESYLSVKIIAQLMIIYTWPPERITTPDRYARYLTVLIYAITTDSVFTACHKEEDYSFTYGLRRGICWWSWNSLSLVRLIFQIARGSN